MPADGDAAGEKNRSLLRPPPPLLLDWSHRQVQAKTRIQRQAGW